MKRLEREYILFHENDPKIDTIRIELPKLEEWYSHALNREVSYEEALTYVDGYGLEPKDQKFKHSVPPDKLRSVYEIVSRKTGKKFKEIKADDLFTEMEDNQEFYEKEIEWIMRENKRRFLGYWFYKKGVPTYMNGWNYFFLNYWSIENEGKNESKPDFRMFHVDVFHFIKWCYTTTMGVFKHRFMWSENGEYKIKYFNSYDNLVFFREVKAKEGIEGLTTLNGGGKGFWEVDMGRRTVLGPNIIKARRQGLTAVLNCIQYCISTEAPNRNTTVAGLAEDSTKELFSKKMVPMIEGIPFYMNPQRARENQSVGKQIFFDYNPESKILWKAGQLEPPLGSAIRVIGNAHTQIDGTRQYFMSKDEFLKVPNGASKSEINEWLEVAARCLYDGSDYIGLMALASTVPKMREGGSEGKRLVDRSHYAQRNDNGRTLTGQVNLFLSTYDGDPSFIDEYGDTVREDPTTPTFDHSGREIKQGSISYFDNIITSLEDSGDMEAVITQKHLHPRFFDEVWEEDREDNGFPIVKMAKRAKELRENPYSGYKRGDFEWTNGVWSKVRFVDNPDNGRWYVSFHLPNHLANTFFLDPSTGMLAPNPSLVGKFYLGADPFRFNKMNHSGAKKSNGSFAIFYALDRSVDSDDVPREKWVSNKFIASYNNKLDDVEDFGWDGIKAMLFFSAMAYPEISEPNFIQFLQRQKMFNFLLYNITPDGTRSKNAGVHATDPNKQDMMKDMLTYFHQNIDYENHPEIIEEWMRLRGVDDLTNRDLCASSGWAVKGSRSMYVELLKQEEEETIIQELFPVYRVS